MLKYPSQVPWFDLVKKMKMDMQGAVDVKPNGTVNSLAGDFHTVIESIQLSEEQNTIAQAEMSRLEAMRATSSTGDSGKTPNRGLDIRQDDCYNVYCQYGATCVAFGCVTCLYSLSACYGG